MSEQELEEQVEGSDENLNEDTGEETWTPDRTSKNKSNWKEMSQALKSEREARAKAEAELDEWRNLNPDVNPSDYKKESNEYASKEDVFLIKYPEAEKHMDKLKEFTDKGFSLKDAWKYVQPTIPVESQTEKDFDIKSKWTTKKVDYSRLSADEIYSWEYSDAQKREWRKVNSNE